VVDDHRVLSAADQKYTIFLIDCDTGHVPMCKALGQLLPTLDHPIVHLIGHARLLFASHAMVGKWSARASPSWDPGKKVKSSIAIYKRCRKADWIGITVIAAVGAGGTSTPSLKLRLQTTHLDRGHGCSRAHRQARRGCFPYVLVGWHARYARASLASRHASPRTHAARPQSHWQSPPVPA